MLQETTKRDEMLQEIYVVKYSEGMCEDYCENIIFATTTESTAIEYVAKFNKMLHKWKDHFRQYEDDSELIYWIKPEFSDKWFNRWHQIKEVNLCYFETVKIR